MESWPQLLPDEREHAVDILLRAACEVAGTGTCVDWDVMKFTAICNETGYYRFDISRLKEDLLDEHDELVRQVDEIVSIYALDRHYEAGAADALRASQWAATFSSIAGLPLVKYVRLSDEERMYVLQAVGRILHTLRECVRLEISAPPVEDFLPAADAMLIWASAATQTADDRFHTFGLLLDFLPSLYTARIPQPHTDSTVFAREADIIDGALLAGEGTVALQHFEGLAVDQQLHVVHNARFAIAEACEQLAQHGTLPDASRLTHRRNANRPALLYASNFAAWRLCPPLPFADVTNRHSTIRLDEDAGGEIGLGAPVERQDRRDITIKPRRPAPPPPSADLAFPTQLSNNPPPDSAPPARTHRHTKSTSSVSHAPIPDPVYPVRSQPIGLTRSSSLSSSSSFGSAAELAAQAIPLPKSPKAEGYLRRLSLSSMSGSEAEKDEGEGEADKPKPRSPTHKHRSESLPAFPPPPIEKQTHNGVSEEELAALPPNPKLWLPSHLSLYLSASLSLPPPVRADITAFIRSSRLSGRTFLRLRDEDLGELGINVRWRAALLEARELLRREALGGRVLWGFEGAAPPPAPAPKGHRRGGSWQGTSVNVEGSASEDESSKDEWKRSWRASQGPVGARERVRGLRRAFETVEEASEGGSPEKPASVRGRVPTAWRHGRSDSAASDMSAASVDSAGGKYASLSRSSPPELCSDDPFLAPAPGPKPPKPRLSLDLDPLAPRLELDLSSAPVSPTSCAAAQHAPPLPFASESPAPARAAQTPRMRPEGTLRAEGARGGTGRRVSFREFSTSASGGENEKGEDDDAERDDDPTLRPVRSPLSSPPMSPRGGPGSLAELFGLDVPRAGGVPDRPGARASEEELVTMFVPGLPMPRDCGGGDEGGETRRGGKKGSLVLVKKSQLAALQRRMSEVEAQLALAIGSEGLPSASEAESEDDDAEDAREWEYKGEEVEERRLREMEGKLQSLELRTTHLTTSLPASPTPSARAFASLPSPPPSATSGTLSTAYPAASTSMASTPRRRRKVRSRREPSEAVTDAAEQEELHAAWPVDGWRQLSGYVFAASIGIGIVAGEVVAAKLLGLRRR
ncbi:hypothetical protein JCM10449v2_006431 [Rhodotorula kratochvilovae]